jgi:hypothetical protein
MDKCDLDHLLAHVTATTEAWERIRLAGHPWPEGWLVVRCNDVGARIQAFDAGATTDAVEHARAVGRRLAATTGQPDEWAWNIDDMVEPLPSGTVLSKLLVEENGSLRLSHPTAEAAIEYLSAGCLRWARRERTA